MIKFKKTPIGKIPEDWEVVKLGKITSYIKGKKPKIIAKEPKDGWLPYLSTEYLRNNNPTQFVKITGNEITVEDEDILLLWDGSNAGEFFLAKKGVLSSTMVKIFLKKDVYDPLFLFYLLKLREPFLKGQTKGTGIPHVDKNVLNTLLLPLPPLPEQKKIAEILRTVDEAIEKTDEAIERTKRLKKGLMQRLLTKGIRHERFKKTELGEIPEEWRVVRLGEIAAKEKYAFVDGPFGSNLKRVHYTDSGILVIQSNYFISGKFELKPPVYYVSEKKAMELKRSIVRPGDILIAKIGVNCGRSAILPSNIKIAVLSGNTMKLTPNRNVVDSRYIVLLLNYWTDIGRIKSLVASKTAQPALTLKGMKNLKIPLPPLSEQKQIAEILSTVDKKLELLRQRREKLERVKRGLMRDLLTGRRRVKVG